MVKKLLSVLIIVILMTSCSSFDSNRLSYKDKKILSKIEKNYEKYNGYKCKANIKILSEDMESLYSIEETYDKPNKYKLEILSPKESKGIIILNTDDKIFVEHPSINESISLVAIKSLNKQLLIGEFYEDVFKAEDIDYEDIDGDSYYIFEFELEEKNQYRDFAKLWIKKKNHIPYKLSIFDDSGSLQVEIIYESFKFTKNFRKKT